MLGECECGVRHRLLSLFLALTCKLFLYFKPKSDDNSVQYFNIPDSPVDIRIWSGGYEEDKNFCLDFFDIRDRTAVNTPDGYIISSVQMPGVDNRWCRLRTVENAFGLQRHHLPPGEERYIVSEAQQLVLSRPGQLPFKFRIPVRAFEHDTRYAQPVMSL
jgi:hypothetical protein